jgi:hypothetical protein
MILTRIGSLGKRIGFIGLTSTEAERPSIVYSPPGVAVVSVARRTQKLSLPERA